jgi:hypothetical protein
MPWAGSLTAGSDERRYHNPPALWWPEVVPKRTAVPLGTRPRGIQWRGDAAAAACSPGNAYRSRQRACLAVRNLI